MNAEDQSNYLDQLLAPYWQDFVAEIGPDDIVLNKEATNAMYLLVKGFMAATLTVNNFEPLPQLTTNDLKNGIEFLTKTSDFDDQMADKADEFLTSSLELGHLFVAWLAHREIISLTDDEVDGVFEDHLLDEEPSLFDDEVFGEMFDEDPDRELYRYDRPELPEYQEEIAKKINVATLTITGDFIQTIGFRKIAIRADDNYSDRVTFCLGGIAGHLYGEYRQTPTEWTGKALGHVMTEYLVKDALLFSKDYQNLGQVLKLFIDFAGEKGFLLQHQITTLKAAVDEAAIAMIVLGVNPDSFSLSKKMVLSALYPTD